MKILALALTVALATCTSASAMLSPQTVTLCEKGSPKEIKAAVKNGSLCVDDVSDQGFTPLMITASMNKNAKATRALIQAGVKVDQCAPATGLTPLMLAAIAGRADTVEVLLEAKASVNARDTMTGNTAFLHAAMTNRDAKVLKLLLKAGAGKYYRSKSDADALMLAALNNPNPEVIRFLVQEAGFWVNDTDTLGQSPLTIAARCNNSPKIIRTLIDLGADPNEDCSIVGTTEGITPLMIAAGNNTNPEVVRELLRNRADGKAFDKEGHTALSYAKQNKYMANTKAYQELWNLDYDARADQNIARFQNGDAVNTLIGATTSVISMPFKLFGK